MVIWSQAIKGMPMKKILSLAGILLLGFGGVYSFAQPEGQLDEVEDLEAQEQILADQGAYFPSYQSSHNSDIDVDRIIYLAASDLEEKSTLVMPKELAKEIRQVRGDQAIRTYRQTIVLGAAATCGLLSAYFIPCGLLEQTSDYCSTTSQYGFEMAGVAIPAGTSYLAQKFYEKERAQFEAARNKRQDSLRQLEHIYLDMSKALLRNYLLNLRLAKENITETQADYHLDLELMSQPHGEQVLDSYLWNIHRNKDQLLLFSDISGFLNNLDKIFTLMMQQGAPADTVEGIKSRFDQLYNLIVDEQFSESKKILLMLIFEHADSRVKLSFELLKLLTCEDLNNILQAYL